MRHKKRFLVIIPAIVALLVLIEVSARLLTKPNLVDLEGEHPFLIETAWHQTGDYARFVPQENDAGCWATAIAQIGHHQGLTPTGSVEYRTSAGYLLSIDLDGYEFRHTQFVPQIDDDTPDVSKEQVAKYIYFIAAVIYTDFGAHQHLEHQTFVQRLEEHLGCSVGFHEYDKRGFLQKRDEIRSLVKGEIDGLRPIMLYFDNGKDWGHAAVIDGYNDEEDRFLVHLNMGCGGRHNGWYDLFHRIIGVRDDLQTRFLITIKPRKAEKGGIENAKAR